MKPAIGEKVRSLREQLGMTQQQVADRVGVTSEFISMLEGGHRVPGLGVIGKLSQLFQRDVSFLLSEEKPVLTMLLRAEGFGEEERLGLSRFVQMCEDYAFIERLVSASPSLVPSYDPPSSLQIKTYGGMLRYAEQLAEAERKRLGLGDEPIRDIFLLLEEQGLHAVRLRLNTNKLAGAFVHSSALGAFILVNSSDSRERQVFTAAHEYCHYLKDRADGVTVDAGRSVEDPDPKSRSPKELIANMFAANFLMPSATVKRLLLHYPHVGAEEVIHLKRYFGVSYLAMVCRLQSLGWIKKSVADEFKSLSPGELEGHFFGVPAESPTAAKEELPSRFVQLAVHAYGEGQITLGRLAELVQSTGPEMRRLLDRSRLLTARGEGIGTNKKEDLE